MRVATSMVMRGVDGLETDLPTRSACGVAMWGVTESIGWKRLFLPLGERMDLAAACGQGLEAQSHHLSLRWTWVWSTVSYACSYCEQSSLSSPEESDSGTR